MKFQPPPPKFCPAVRIHGGFQDGLCERHVTIELSLLHFKKALNDTYFSKYDFYFEFSVFIVLLVSILGGQDELVGG